MQSPDEDLKDFRTLIREADTHAEAEAVMAKLAPQRVEELCRQLAMQRGELTKSGNGYTFETAEFRVKYVHTMDEVRLYRKSEDHNRPNHDDCVFHVREGKIWNFEPFRTWNVVSLLQEIKKTGQISI